MLKGWYMVNACHTFQFSARGKMPWSTCKTKVSLTCFQAEGEQLKTRQFQPAMSARGTLARNKLLLLNSQLVFKQLDQNTLPISLLARITAQQLAGKLATQVYTFLTASATTRHRLATNLLKFLCCRFGLQLLYCCACVNQDQLISYRLLNANDQYLL